MTKVLIISYYHNPCHFAGAIRSRTWQKYFHEFGVFPTIVTRKWPETTIKWNEQFIPIEGALEIVNDSKSEVHYLPYQKNFFNSIMLKRLNGQDSIGNKIGRFVHLILSKLSFKYEPIKGLKAYCDTLLQENSYDMLLITTNPYELFKLGYHMNRKHNIPWVADYQDDWTTNGVLQEHWLKQFVLNKMDILLEKRWLQSAVFFSSVTPTYVTRIENSIQRPGICSMLGIEEVAEIENEQTNNDFTVSYIGTIYPSQNFNHIFACFNQLNASNDKQIKFQLIGIGQYGIQYISQLAEKFKNVKIEIIPWLNLEELNQYASSSQLFYLTTYNQEQGVIPSKVFDYVKYNKPIIFYPSDEGQIKNVLNEFELGIFGDSIDDLASKIDSVMNDTIKPILNQKAHHKYASKSQVKILADAIIKEVAANS